MAHVLTQVGLLLLSIGLDSASTAFHRQHVGHPACKRSEVRHGEILYNRSLAMDMVSGNYSFLGSVKDIQDCMALCCSMKGCNIAYMRNSSCYGVICRNSDLCFHKNMVEEGGTKLSLMLKHSSSGGESTTTYTVIVISSFAAATIGTMWAIIVFYQRYRSSRVSVSESESEYLVRKQ